MAIQRFKIALNNALFPLVSTKAQRAVFVPGLDSAPRTPRARLLRSSSSASTPSRIRRSLITLCSRSISSAAASITLGTSPAGWAILRA